MKVSRPPSNFDSTSKTRSRQRNQQHFTVLQHEGIKCSRKYGNGVAHKFGNQRRTPLFDERISEAKGTPGPLSYSPSTKQTKPRAAAALCHTGEQRMGFQKPGTVTPSPLDYHSQNSDSKRESFKSSSTLKGIEFSKSLSNFAKAAKGQDRFYKSTKSDLSPGDDIPSQLFSQSMVNTRSG